MELHLHDQKWTSSERVCEGFYMTVELYLRKRAHARVPKHIPFHVAFLQPFLRL